MYAGTFLEYADDLMEENLFVGDAVGQAFDDSGEFGKAEYDNWVAKIIEAGMREMREVAREASQELTLKLFDWQAEHVRWICPDEECSGLYQEHPAYLERDGGGWHCPKCGCWTCAPEEDACIKEIV